MSRQIEMALTDGLLAGYAGGIPEEVNRAGFDGSMSHVGVENGVYHDEWFVDTHVGGGQELVSKNGEKFTRMYAGGTPDPEVLEALGINGKDVSNYLKSKIIELGDKTRLLKDCLPDPDGDWQYAYRVTSRDDFVQLTTGMETITYKESPVHLHAFILSPIK